jgi:hypothetical protein
MLFSVFIPESCARSVSGLQNCRRGALLPRYWTSDKPKEPAAPVPAATKWYCPAVDTLPACRKCSGVRLNVDCIACGKKDELHSGSRCWSGILAMIVDRILSPPDNQPRSPELQAVATALKATKRANNGLTWIRHPHVTEFFQEIATAPMITQ